MIDKQKNTHQKFAFVENFTDEALGYALEAHENFVPYEMGKSVEVYEDATGDSNIDIDRLIQDAYEQGFREGRIYAGDTEQSYLAQVGQKMQQSIDELNRNFQDIHRNLGQTVSAILTQTVRSVLHSLPLDSIAENLEHQIRKIHVAIPDVVLHVTLHKQCINRLQHSLTTSIQQKVIVLKAQENGAFTDCKIAWENGGWEIRLDQFVDQIITYLSKPETTTDWFKHVSTTYKTDPSKGA